jgi:hypothetical protein
MYCVCAFLWKCNICRLVPTQGIHLQIYETPKNSVRKINPSYCELNLKQNVGLQDAQRSKQSAVFAIHTSPPPPPVHNNTFQHLTALLSLAPVTQYSLLRPQSEPSAVKAVQSQHTVKCNATQITHLTILITFLYTTFPDPHNKTPFSLTPNQTQ